MYAAAVIIYNRMPCSQSVSVAISTRVCAIAADVLVLVVIWKKTWHTHREAAKHDIKTPLATMLLRDGMFDVTYLLPRGS